MAGQNWTTHGTYLANDELSKEMRHQMQPMAKFRQFCAFKADFGKGKGDALNYDFVSNVATGGGTLTETNTVTETTLTFTQGTMGVTEYGLSVPYTLKAKTLSQFDLTATVKKALKNDMVKTLDAAVEAQMDTCLLRYVASSASAYNLYTDGTATQTASVGVDAFHVRKIVDALMVRNVPMVGGTYFCIGTVSHISQVHSALTDVWKYTKNPLNAEVGQWYSCRFVRDTNSMDNSIGTSDVTGEAYYFGGDQIYDGPVMEGVAMPEELRVKLGTDYGRDMGVAWLYLGGFKLIHDSNSNDRNVIKFDSA
jgi:N4-gp56 family major capsid protein